LNRRFATGPEVTMAWKRQFVVALVALAAFMPAVAHAERPAPPGMLTLAIAAADTDTFIDEWVSTPASHAPVIRRVHEVGPDKNIYIAFIVSGHLRDATGCAHVDVDWVVRRPDGKIDNAQLAFSKLRGKGCFGRGFAMADPALTYTFEPTDPAGVWRIEATARDRVNGKSVSAVFPITLRK
jgi:hypothetical protein